MAEAKICVCPQCGKKFKLKPDFASASFACTSCSGTVWVEGKPKGPPATRRKTSPSRASGGKSTGGRSGGRAGAKRGGRAAGGKAPASRGQRRGRAPAADEGEDEGRPGRGRYQKQNNSQNVIIAVMGLVIVLGAVGFFLMSGDKDKPDGENQANANNTSSEDGTNGGMNDSPEGDGTEPTGTDGTAGNDPAGGDPETDGGNTSETNGEEKTPDKKPIRTTKTKYRIDAKTGKRVRISKWNPPDELTHLESTSAEDRKTIDALIVTMFDHFAGKDSFDAKQKLAQMGKPAYIPILMSIVKAKKRFKWDNQHDDNVQMSSVKLADECLRLMDGYLEANGIGVLRPGTEEGYYGYVVRMHYKRWKKTLEALDEMPGPFDPSSEYEEETEKSD